MLLFKISVALCLLEISSGFFFGPDWSGLKVTYGLNPFRNFNSLPRTESDAIEEGFVLISGCSVSSTAKWRGKRYIKNNDTIAILLFDKNGYIAGIQGGITEEPSYQYPTAALLPPFVQDGDKYYITAYFTDPDTICTVGRTEEEFESQGTGTKLLIQNGNNPDTDFMEIPKEQRDIQGTAWVEGGCILGMGQHYWNNVLPDTDCNSIYPVFALYNYRRKLTAFGWAFVKHVDSPRAEYPPLSSYHLFLSPVPKCLLETEPMIKLSTMHIYLGPRPATNWCR